jgi:hypothetical protein
MWIADLPFRYPKTIAILYFGGTLNGVVRSEEGNDKVILLNSDDIGQELNLVPSV